MKISIIIRTHNEERWIASCLRAVFAQKLQDFEVIIVDNESIDATLARVEQFPVAKVLFCTDYLPGKSLNIGIEAARGDYIVCLSGHCIPVNNYWLENLLENFNDPEVAGVYGRQEPLSFTPPGDKRDLMIVFGPERRVQKKDSFFHNANSMIRRDVLTKYPFDSLVTNIEDRLWAREILQHGYKIVYEPEASVYHHHGIHQDGNEERCRNVVRILEGLDNKNYDLDHLLQIQNLSVAALIPVKGHPASLGEHSLLEYTVAAAKNSSRINSMVVAADRDDVLTEAKGLNVDMVVRRDGNLSQEYVGLEEVYRYTLERLELVGIFPDILVLLEITYPFRPPNLLDDMIEKMILKGFDSMLPARRESNVIWMEGENGIRQVTEGFVPRKFQKPVYLGCKGLCCVTRPEFIRDGRVVGDNLGIYHLDNPYAHLEIRGEGSFELPAFVLPRPGRGLRPRSDIAAVPKPTNLKNKVSAP
ncbi:MAG TPA: glycosyltransferase [Desulfobacterales bacterium]|nr:glycosyltransferase [Desulfobacterales bacterium]